MIELNCLGDMCPVPIIRLKNALKSAKKEEQIKLITDHSCVLQSVDDFLRATSHTYYSDEVMNGVWEIFVTKA